MQLIYNFQKVSQKELETKTSDVQTTYFGFLFYIDYFDVYKLLRIAIVCYSFAYESRIVYKKITEEEINETITYSTTENINYNKNDIFMSEREDIHDTQFIFCENCRTSLEEPYISCAECPQYFCLDCFSCGTENSIHKTTHSYRVLRVDNIRIFQNTDWYAYEEKRLLDLLLVHGYGNWDDIAKAIKTRSPEECRDHYLSCYFGGIFEKTMGLSNDSYQSEIVPYMYKMSSIDPPRYDIDNINFKRMAGYRCARSDFDTPYDTTAETLISNLALMNDENELLKDDEYDENEQNGDSNYLNEHKDVYEELNCAMVNAYNHRLQ